MKKKMKIAIISDTHSLIRPEVLEFVRGCDYLLHGGDIASAETYDRLRALAPSYFVRGNADQKWTAGSGVEVPEEQDFEIAGYHFYMIHNIRRARKDLSGVDFVIYGHSHKYEHRKEGQIVYLNPGSCGPRRFTQPVTMMLMIIDENRSCRIEKMDISPTLKRGFKYPPEKEMDELIKRIIKDMNANRTVEQIAERNRVEKELVEEILQIYTTHPGIDIDGILDRMS